jgi:hypothetical protein
MSAPRGAYRPGGVKGPASEAVAAAHRSWRQSGLGGAGLDGKQPRQRRDVIGTARRRGSGKRDGEVHERRNQWWNPRKSRPSSNLVDGGWVLQCTPTAVMGDSQPRHLRAEPEATVNDCGVAVAMLPGKSWAPIPSNGRFVNVGTATEPPTRHPARATAGSRTVR